MHPTACIHIHTQEAFYNLQTDIPIYILIQILKVYILSHHSVLKEISEEERRSFG